MLCTRCFAPVFQVELDLSHTEIFGKPKTLEDIPMLSTAWMCIRLLGISAGLGMVWLGLSVMDDDDEPDLEFASGGAGVVLLFVAATFLPF